MAYQARGGRGASKATNTTLCQKCLQKGHYSYECKSSAQERPYVSRPSRSQQFNNPRLRPQLTNDKLADDSDKKGIADGILAKNASERSRKRSLDDLDPARPPKRSRSISSYSSDSVSTISTRSSRSRSPPRRSIPQEDSIAKRGRDGGERTGGTKRRRATSSVSSTEGRARTVEDGRNTRLRKRSSSPGQRGRASHRSPSLDRRNGNHVRPGDRGPRLDASRSPDERPR